jgi:WD40 repeat protein
VGGWVIVLSGLGAVAYLSTEAPADPEARPVEADRPHSQTARDGLGGVIWSLAFSPGDTRLAAASVEGDVWLKDLAAGLLTHVRSGPLGSSRSLAFSPDGRVLAVAGYGPGVWLWDVERGAELDPLPVDGGQVKHAGFSGDGARLAVGGDDGAVSVWDWVRRRRLATFEAHRADIVSLALSPDGSRLLSADATGEMILRDVDAGTERARSRPHEPGGLVTSAVFSPDGALFATAGVSGGPVRLWDAASGAPRGSLPRTDPGVHALAFSPGGDALAVARGDGTATIWDVAHGKQLGVVRAPTGSLRAVAFSAGGRTLATGGGDGSVRLWDVAQALGGPRPAGT